MNTDGAPGRSCKPMMLALIWLAGVAYAAALMGHTIGAPVRLGLTFNDMLSHLSRGRFDISPATIGYEAYEHDGRSYAYFGPFCALLRLPLLITGKNGLDVTGVSVLVAAALSLACRLVTATTIMDRVRGAALSPILQAVVLAAIATNGESVQFLHPSVFQEVVSWADALTSGFVLLAARLVLGVGARGAAAYAAMALIAGLTLLCRVTFGLGLYCALGLMMGAAAFRTRSAREVAAGLSPAAAVLIVFAALIAGVNDARWGDPLTFAPLQDQRILQVAYPDRTQRLERYGAVNARRIPFSLQDDVAPIWALTDGKGDLVLQKQQVDLFDDVELPPSSLLLSDPVACVLAALGLATLARKPKDVFDPVLAGAVLFGLAIPACLMLTAISLTFRYRMEFYPALNVAAWIGLAALAGRAAPLPRLFIPALGLSSATGAVVAALSLIAYVITPLGPATDLDTAHGWASVIADRMAGRSFHRGHLMPDGGRIPHDGLAP